MAWSSLIVAAKKNPAEAGFKSCGLVERYDIGGEIGRQLAVDNANKSQQRSVFIPERDGDGAADDAGLGKADAVLLHELRRETERV